MNGMYIWVQWDVTVCIHIYTHMCGTEMPLRNWVNYTSCNPIWQFQLGTNNDLPSPFCMFSTKHDRSCAYVFFSQFWAMANWCQTPLKCLLFDSGFWLRLQVFSGFLHDAMQVLRLGFMSAMWLNCGKRAAEPNLGLQGSFDKGVKPWPWGYPKNAGKIPI